MLRNYLKIAYRNFARYKAFTLINLSGLSIGLACAILIYLFIAHEFSFDAFHAGAIYRVVAVEKNLGTGADEYTITQPYLLGPALLDDLPEVASFVRTSFSVPKFVKRGSEVYEEEFVFADSTLFRVFSFPLVSGNPDYALRRPQDVAISERAAEKYFGKDNPLGKTLSIRVGDTYEDYTVSAVFQDIPTNSSIRSDFFLPMMKETLGKSSTYINDPNTNLWYVSSFQTYVLLHENAYAADMTEKLARVRNQYFPTEAEFLRKRKAEAGEDLARTYLLQPLADMHLDTAIPDQNSGSKPIYSYILAGIAAGVLLLACINFTLLSVSRSHSRAKEVGVRKVVGARRSQLMVQFWGEALLTSGLALILALILGRLALPLFNNLAHKSLSFDTLLQPHSLLVLGALPLLTAAVAGAYPSLLLAGLDTLSVVKNKLSVRTGTFPRVLLATQFILPLVFLTVTAVMIAQLRFMRQKDLGFQAEQIVVIENNAVEKPPTFERFSQLAQQQPAVRAVTATDAAFTRSSTMLGMRQREEDEMQFIWAYDVQPNFFDVLDINLVEGRVFNERMASDTTEAIIVNEAFVKLFGLADPIGAEIEGSRIIGVVADFNFQSLDSEIAPMAFYLPNERTSLQHLLVQLQSDDLPRSIAVLSDSWKQVAPDLPFQYSFLDEDMQALYDEDARWTRILQGISALSVFIACLGLVGVMGLTVARRTKEIGVRKVLGASVHSLLLLLSKDYVKLILIAFVIAIPVANYGITEWLQSFAYRIEISWWLFALPGLLVLLIALLSVSAQTLKAARRNPVDSLRNE